MVGRGVGGSCGAPGVSCGAASKGRAGLGTPSICRGAGGRQYREGKSKKDSVSGATLPWLRGAVCQALRRV